MEESNLPNPRQQFGRTGESRALNFLEKKGFNPISQNYWTRWGELDLVMWDKTHLVFVEVKSRHSQRMGTGVEAISRSKQARLTKAAWHFISRENKIGCMVRFDVVIIGPDGITHYENAFPSTGNLFY